MRVVGPCVLLRGVSIKNRNAYVRFTFAELPKGQAVTYNALQPQDRTAPAQTSHHYTRGGHSYTIA
jgi:hypothetical protein